MTRLRPPGIIPMFFLLAALLLPAATAAGMDLQAMLDQALENDLRLKSLSGVLANTLLNIERARLAPGFQMKLSTGEVRLGYSFAPEAGDPPWTISRGPIRVRWSWAGRRRPRSTWRSRSPWNSGTARSWVRCRG